MFDRVLFYLDNCSVICRVTSCYVLHQAHSEFWHIQISVYSGKFRHIQAYSALLRHINRWGITKDYWGLFRHTQNPVQPSHVHKLTTFWALTYLKPKAYSKLCETLTRHIQNPVIEQFIQTLFSHIQAYPEPCVTLAHVETWHIWNHEIQNPSIFSKALYLRSLGGFYIR